MLVGTDTSNLPPNQTKNFTVQELSDYLTNGLQYLDVSIQGTIVQQLFSTPYEILPAPGVGKAIVIYDYFMGMFPYSPPSYNFVPQNADYVIDYLDPTTGASAYKWVSEGTNLLSGGQDEGVYFQNNATYNVFPTLENKKLTLRLENTSDATQGNSPLNIKMTYKIFSST
jgi:hypothetical protein